MVPMVVSAIFFVDFRGRPVIGRVLRSGDLPRSLNAVMDCFLVLRNELALDAVDDRPCFHHGGLWYAFLTLTDVYLVAVTRYDPPLTDLMTWLHRCALAIFDFVGHLNDAALKDNFILVYELLDEFGDFGHASAGTTDPPSLRKLVTQRGMPSLINPSKRTAPNSSNVAGTISWRQPGIKYKRNEVFLDVLEFVDCALDSSGDVLSTSIRGSLEVKCRLSGMPELKLGLNDRVLLENRILDEIQLEHDHNVSSKTDISANVVDMEDIKFHQCVRLDRFHLDRAITFIPPDGDFSLLAYRIAPTSLPLENGGKPIFAVSCQTVHSSASSLELSVRLKSQFRRKSTGNRVVVEIPLPEDVSAVKCKPVTGGAASYRPERGSVVCWHLGFVSGGGKEHKLTVKASFPSLRSSNASLANQVHKPMTVSFEIPYFTVSGVQVRYLRVVEASGYTAMPWVRYLTHSGTYTVRMPDMAFSLNVNDDKDNGGAIG